MEREREQDNLEREKKEKGWKIQKVVLRNVKINKGEREKREKSGQKRENNFFKSEKEG